MTRVLGLKNGALVYFVRCDLQRGGPTARGPGHGAGPRTRGARAAPPPRPPAAGPQPWTRRGGAAPERRGSRGPRRGSASTGRPRPAPSGRAAAAPPDSTCSPRAAAWLGPGGPPRLRAAHPRPPAPAPLPLPLPPPPPRTTDRGQRGEAAALVTRASSLLRLPPPLSGRRRLMTSGA